MSDAGRKDLSSQVGDKMKPDSQKTATEKVGDALSGAYDRVAAAVTPESQKSTSQSTADSSRGAMDEASSRTKGAIDNLTGKK